MVELEGLPDDSGLGHPLLEHPQALIAAFTQAFAPQGVTPDGEKE